jgi:hypothetical protein
MLPNRPKNARTALLLAALGLGAGLAQAGSAAADGDRAAKAGPAAGLTVGEFNELKPALDVKNQPWTRIPWKYSITEARKLAAATKKPIFMVVNTGNCLGCT